MRNKMVGLCSLLLLAACQGEESKTADGSEMGEGGAPGEAQGSAVVELRSKAVRIPSKTTEALQAAQGEQDFAFRFLQKLPDRKNIAFSPHNLSVAFAMLTDSASDATLTQIQQAFGFGDVDEAFHRSQNALLQGLRERNHGPADIGNRRVDAQLLEQSSDVWLRKDAPPQATFLDTLGQYYGSGVHQADFANRAKEVREAINDKVATDTHGLIPALLPKESLSPDTLLVLTSALYFKAPWAQPFPFVTTEDFHDLDGGTQSTAMLGNLSSMAYYAGDRFVSVTLPYAGNELSMVLLVPEQGAYDDVRATLTGDVLSDVVAGSAPTRVDLRLPKFALDTRVPTVKTLKDLGITEAFSETAASFPKLQSPKVQQVYVKDVQHQATVKIDKDGTEASAATAIQAAGGGSAGPVAQPDPVLVDVDHPFLFVIRDNPTGSVLFVGQVVNPSEQ